MVTLRDPQTGDYSIIAETKGAKKAQKIRISVDGLSANKLCVWYSDATQQFVRLKDIAPRGGSFSFTLKPAVRTRPATRCGAFVKPLATILSAGLLNGTTTPFWAIGSGRTMRSARMSISLQATRQA